MFVILFFFMEKLRDLSHNQFSYAIFSILLEISKKKIEFREMVTAIVSATSLSGDDSLQCFAFLELFAKNWKCLRHLISIVINEWYQGRSCRYLIIRQFTVSCQKLSVMEIDMAELQPP